MYSVKRTTVEYVQRDLLTRNSRTLSAKCSNNTFPSKLGKEMTWCTMRKKSISSSSVPGITFLKENK